MLCKNTGISLNIQIWVQIIDFFRLFKYAGRVGKPLLIFCHLLKIAIFFTLLVQNSMHYVNIMTFESSLDAFLFKTGMFQRIEN